MCNRASFCAPLCLASLALTLGCATRNADFREDADAAQAVVTRALQEYRSLESYRDRMVASELALGVGIPGTWFRVDRGSLVADGAERLRLKVNDCTAHVIDQKVLHVHGSASPEALTIDAKYSSGAVSGCQPMSAPSRRFDYHPVVRILTDSDYILTKGHPVGLQRETRGGRRGTRVFYELSSSEGPPAPFLLPRFQTAPHEYSYWFDEESGLLGEIRLDMTRDYQKLLAGFLVPELLLSYQFAIEFHDIRTNEPIDPSEFETVITK